MECVGEELNETFGLNLTELTLDLEEVVQRWDALCATLENLSAEINKEKSTPKRKEPKTDSERIDMKLMEEVRVLFLITF